jgi:hypothetical protein
MRVCEAKLESVSPYSQSRYYQTEKLEKENAQDYEARTWKDRLHTSEDGMVYIPPMAFKNALSEIARFLSVQIPGKGKSTYTKHFEAGVLVMDAVPLGIHKDQVLGEWLFVPSDGKRGGGSRVLKCFPLIKEWKATVTFYVLDETVTPTVFEHHLKEAGSFVGIGRFRPRNNGFYGRFKVVSTKWSQRD